MNQSNRALVEQIEQLVREHLEVTRRAVAAAVEQAFSPMPEASRGRTRSEVSRVRRTASRGRRSKTEFLALTERLHEAMCAHPGETMSVLAPIFGTTAREMEGPVKALKRATALAPQHEIAPARARHRCLFFELRPTSSVSFATCSASAAIWASRSANWVSRSASWASRSASVVSSDVIRASRLRGSSSSSPAATSTLDHDRIRPSIPSATEKAGA